jgi:hypothetical protein
MKLRRPFRPSVWIALIYLGSGIGTSRGADDSLESRLRLLQQQNEQLQQQLQTQQEQIESLSREMQSMRAATSTPPNDNSLPAATLSKESDGPAGFRFGNLRITGEGAVGFFHTGSEGAFPNAEFRVDEAKLFFDAAVWGDVYGFAEVNLATREADNLDLRLGEFYFDVENISQWWGMDGLLSLRAGRFDIPFGEEYLVRDAIDNPLISHSLMDFWGVDEGVELYGAQGPVSYAVAVQNGGVSVTRDFTSDKSIAGRVAWDPTRWLRLSLSGMRTGDLDAEEDGLSEMWFGNGWFRSIGSPATTRFHANLVEGDIELRLDRGHLKAFGGYITYDDNDPLAQNRRDVYFYSVESVWNVTRKLHAGARFGQILAPKGFPIVGHGNMGEYLFGPLTDDLWRLSLGLGYRWNRHFIVKAEYALEHGRKTGGGDRENEDLFATQAAFAF